jgi:hypothetical protein
VATPRAIAASRSGPLIRTTRAAVAAAIGAALGLGACGPTVRWAGRTADGRHAIEVIEHRGDHAIAIDGLRRPAPPGVAGPSVVVAPNGALALAARAGAGWVVVHRPARGGADRVSAPWDAVRELALTPDARLTYAAAARGGWHAVIDGVAGPRFDEIAPGSIRILPGGHVTYQGRRAGSAYAVVGGAVGPALDAAGVIAVAPSGRYAYAGRRGADAFVVQGGPGSAPVVGPRWSAIGHLAVAPRGPGLAYAALDREGWRIVVDGRAGPIVGAVRLLRYRDDGQHLAWIARQGERDVLGLDGEPVADAAALRASSVALRPAGAPGAGPGLAYVSGPRGREAMVVDGVAGPHYDEVGDPVWSADGRLAYAARRGTAWTLVVDGRERARGAAVGDPVFSPDGKRLAYLVRRAGALLVVADERPHRFDLAIEGTIAFSRDSRRWAVIAGDRAARELFVALDGGQRVPIAGLGGFPGPHAPHPMLADLGTVPHERLRAWSAAAAEAGPPPAAPPPP